jgi:hypothetical protein
MMMASELRANRQKIESRYGGNAEGPGIISVEASSRPVG